MTLPFAARPETDRWLHVIQAIWSSERPTAMAEIFSEKASQQLLCAEAIAIFRDEPSCLSIPVGRSDLHAEGSSSDVEGKASAIEDRLVLVGDVHGQLRDLLAHVLSVQAAARDAHRPDVRFLFLGDYVDRGPCGVEVFTLLLALKVTYPKHIYMIRGNHEEFQTCGTYGFLVECKAKLDEVRWKNFVDVFYHLPLAATISVAPSRSLYHSADGGTEGDKHENCSERKIFCCHGGLSPSLGKIALLDEIQRSEYGRAELPGEQSEIVDGLLWSDPTDVEDAENYRRNPRGCGYSFTSAATEEFFAVNPGVVLLCRAHQMVMAGYQFTQNSKVLTLFSASNYCGFNNNRGAIAIIDAADQPEADRPVNIKFESFMAEGTSAPGPRPNEHFKLSEEES